MLREPQPDVVQFVHHTFRDYLAAKEVVDSGDLAHLVEHGRVGGLPGKPARPRSHRRPAPAAQVTNRNRCRAIAHSPRPTRVTGRPPRQGSPC